MTYMSHHAIIVTANNHLYAINAHEAAMKLFPVVSPILENRMEMATSQSYFTFLVPPDGSGEGWETSDHFDVQRQRFIDWLNSQRFEDGSSPFAWVEVQYGDDEGETQVIRHSDESEVIE